MLARNLQVEAGPQVTLGQGAVFLQALTQGPQEQVAVIKQQVDQVARPRIVHEMRHLAPRHIEQLPGHRNGVVRVRPSVRVPQA